MPWTAVPALNTGDPFDKPTYDIIKGDLEWLQGGSWTAVATGIGYKNSWVDGGVGLGVSYRTNGDFVVLSGSCKTGASGAVAFTLPVGLRPTRTAFFPIVVVGGIGYVTIASNGDVTPNQLTGSATSGSYLDGIRVPVVGP